MGARALMYCSTFCRRVSKGSINFAYCKHGGRVSGKFLSWGPASGRSFYYLHWLAPSRFCQGRLLSNKTNELKRVGAD